MKEVFQEKMKSVNKTDSNRMKSVDSPGKGLDTRQGDISFVPDDIIVNRRPLPIFKDEGSITRKLPEKINVSEADQRRLGEQKWNISGIAGESIESSKPLPVFKDGAENKEMISKTNGADVAEDISSSSTEALKDELEQDVRESHDNDSPEQADNTTEQNRDSVKSAKMESSETKEPFRDTGKDCLTSYEERLQQTPREGWDGERGESVCTKETESLGEVKVNYENGIPDFSPYAKETVEIPNMSGERYGEGGNFEQADNALAEQWNRAGKDSRHDWTGAEVRDWRRENLSDYTWHECSDRKTCQLVPREINASFGHMGGVGECNKLASMESRENLISKDMNSSFDIA